MGNRRPPNSRATEQLMNSRRLIDRPRLERCSLAHWRSNRRVVHYSKIERRMSASGHSRPSHFVPVLNNVRYASDSDHSRYESELTLWAIFGLMRRSKTAAHSIISSARADWLGGSTAVRERNRSTR